MLGNSKAFLAFAFICGATWSVAQRDVEQSSYPLTSINSTVTAGWFDKMSGLAIVKWRSRKKVDLPLSSNAFRTVSLYLDTFVTDDGRREIHALTGSEMSNLSVPSPKAHYCLIFQTSPGKAHLLTVNHMGVDQVVQAIGEESWVTGIGLVPCKTLREKGNDVQTNLLLTIGDLFSKATTADEAFALCELVRALSPNDWVNRQFGGVTAGSWCRDTFEPIATTNLDKKAGDVKIQVLAACSSMPGSRLRHKFFETRVALDRRGVHPFLKMGKYAPDVTVDELAAAAIASPFLRQHFYSAIEDPPSDKFIKTFVDWAESGPSDFAMEILGDLARWSGRKDLKPKHAPRADADGQPIILNRVELIKVWRENPPPIKRKPGG
jgi:hypothetical protein